MKSSRKTENVLKSGTVILIYTPPFLSLINLKNAFNLHVESIFDDSDDDSDDSDDDPDDSDDDSDDDPDDSDDDSNDSDGDSDD